MGELRALLFTLLGTTPRDVAHMKRLFFASYAGLLCDVDSFTADEETRLFAILTKQTCKK